MPRILVLDDEPLIAMMVQNWLAELHCETIGPVYSVASALALLEGVTLDGALLDLSLRNNETCYAVASALRARDVPFVFATGYDDPLIDAQFKDTLILSKPFEYEAVKAAVSRLRSEEPERGPSPPKGDLWDASGR
jgi:CheY-like chemotaxis protein